MPTLRDIAALLNVSAPEASETVAVTGLATLRDAGPTEISFLGSDAYRKDFLRSNAGAVLVQKRVKLDPDPPMPVLIVEDADIAVAKVLDLFAPVVPHPQAGVHPSATVAASASLEDECGIGPHVSIGERSRLGARCKIHAGVVIGDDVTIGDDCQIFPNVVVRERITIGNRVVIHAGSVLGTDGFGYRWDGKQHAKIPQIGTVVIEDDVEIGSCVCIDRAKFATTRVGHGSKIDNLVQIGHNVQMGAHCILVGQSGLAGSVRLGVGVVIGGQTAVRDHVNMADGSMAAACTGVAEDVQPKSIVSGVPALPHRQALREQAALRRLPDIVVQMRKLQEEVERLRKLVAHDSDPNTD